MPARHTAPNVHYRIGSIAGFFIVATAVFFDTVGFLLVLTGLGAIVTEIMGITGAIMFFLWFTFHHVNYLSGRSLQKLGIMGAAALIEAIPFINGISPTFTIQTVLLIRITRKEDREKAQKEARADEATRPYREVRYKEAVEGVLRARRQQAALAIRELRQARDEERKQSRIYTPVLQDSMEAQTRTFEHTRKADELQQRAREILQVEKFDIAKEEQRANAGLPYFDSDEAKLQRKQWLEDAIAKDTFDAKMLFILQGLYGKDQTRMANLARRFIEKRGLQADDFLQHWEMAHIDPIVGFAAAKRLEDRLPGAMKTLSKEFGIYNFSRYPTEVLVDQYNNRANMQEPYGILIYPADDHNGAFGSDSIAIEKMYSKLKGKYLLRIMEADGKFALGRHMVSLDTRYGKDHKISFAIFGGHGAKNIIQLGPVAFKVTFKDVFNFKKALSFNDLVEKRDLEGVGFRRALSFFENNPAIVLVSCSTGKEGGIGQKISESYGADVNAPNKPTNLSDLGVSFDQNGRVVFNTVYRHEEAGRKYFRGVPS